MFIRWRIQMVSQHWFLCSHADIWTELKQDERLGEAEWRCREKRKGDIWTEKVKISGLQERGREKWKPWRQSEVEEHRYRGSMSLERQIGEVEGWRIKWKAKIWWWKCIRWNIRKKKGVCEECEVWRTDMLSRVDDCNPTVREIYLRPFVRW